MTREILVRQLLAAAALAVAAPGALAAQKTAEAASVRLASTAPAAADSAKPGLGAPRRAELISFERESYAYGSDGRRDPFQSLMSNGELRPLIGELRLVGVIYEPNGGSVAMLRDLVTKEQYRVRQGQSLGRMRVASIQPKKVVFTIEEFGFSRQETLALGESNTERTQQ